MNWTAMQFDWNRARAFLATVEEGSLSSAARALGSTQPTVGRQVAALEGELGVALFERVGGGLELTSTGLELVAHVRAMGEAATRVSLAATGRSSAIEGIVCITASESIAAFLLPPILARLRVEYPAIELELVVSNDARDLQRREADIAVRNFQTTQPELIARKVRDLRAQFYAAPAYVERAGPFETQEDLARAELFGFDRSDVMVDGFKAIGLDVRRDQFPIVTGNHLVQWELCKQGSGVCMMMAAVGEPEPQVVQVFSELPSLPVPLWIVSHRELRTSRRIRLVFDWLADGLAGPG
ncbi:MAG: LysR family transcriptional regulator [Proteobacteria bacterium]|nr:LysR family transcriptional regulator [Pseudomonadota bacterium]MCP4922187.1 LysR family transcriptional regulator [Pseudomonadota bacterium]